VVFLFFFLWLLLVSEMDSLMKFWCFGGHCSISVWISVCDAHLHLQHQRFMATTLIMLLYYYLHYISVQPSGLVFLSDAIAYFCSY
jgi:hypothetical protein